MSGLIGIKIGMTSLFDEKGKNIPCTAVSYTHLTLPTILLV